MKPIKKKTTQKINPKEIQKSFMETVEESLVSQGVKFFEVDNGLNIDSEWLELPQSITEISSRELGECLNAFTQQKMYLRTLLGRIELWVEDAKRAYLSAGDKTYKALSNGKLSETAKERLINSDENVKPLYYEYREELNDMCNLSEGIEEKGMKKGMKKGIETGRLETIAECLRNGTMNDAKRLLKATGEEIEKATELFLKKGE